MRLHHRFTSRCLRIVASLVFVTLDDYHHLADLEFETLLNT
jgi:hypothetical protein